MSQHHRRPNASERRALGALLSIDPATINARNVKARRRELESLRHDPFDVSYDAAGIPVSTELPPGFEEMLEPWEQALVNGASR